jgi:hypothetical protein
MNLRVGAMMLALAPNDAPGRKMSDNLTAGAAASGCRTRP